jgi:hypothetical protein
MLDSRMYKDFFKGALEIPLIDCELRQCGCDQPYIYKGPALLSQNEHGGLILQFFAIECPRYEATNASWLGMQSRPGELIPETEYFDFIGFDRFRHPWRSQRLSGSWQFGASTYVKFDVHSIKRTYEYSRNIKKRGSYIEAYTPGKFKLPWHALTRSDVGSTIDLFEAEYVEFKWRIRNAGDGIRIAFYVVDGDVEPHFRRFLSALSIVTGRPVDPIMIHNFDRTSQTTSELRTRQSALSTASLVGPLPQHAPRASAQEASSTHNFIRAFLMSIECIRPVHQDLTSHVYELWHRVLRAGQHDISNSALVLSVAIEALLDKVFRSEVDIDQEFLQEVNQAKEILSGLPIQARARGRIAASLDGAAKPSARSVMYRLAKQGFLQETNIADWKKLRNAAAHGEDLDDQSRLQSNLDLYYKCLGLFYRLIFVVIRYRGDYVDYSKRGWPDSKFV